MDFVGYDFNSYKQPHVFLKDKCCFVAVQILRGFLNPCEWYLQWSQCSCAGLFLGLGRAGWPLPSPSSSAQVGFRHCSNWRGKAEVLLDQPDYLGSQWRGQHGFRASIWSQTGMQVPSLWWQLLEQVGCSWGIEWLRHP